MGQPSNRSESGNRREGARSRRTDDLWRDLNALKLQVAVMEERQSNWEAKGNGLLEMSEILLKKMHANSKAVIEMDVKTLKRVNVLIYSVAAGLGTAGLALLVNLLTKYL